MYLGAYTVIFGHWLCALCSTSVKFDSLCILQRDRPDWEVETSCMHGIHGNAFLVIAASLWPAPSNGIFSARPRTARFEIHWAGNVYHISAKQRVERDAWQLRRGDDRRGMPLHSRA